MEHENIYWLFSSSAQSVSAFVALLVAAFAIVLTMMDNAASQDDSLLPIHAELRKKYHLWLSWLCAITGLAIVSSLAITYFNGTHGILHPFWPLLSFVFNAASIFGAIWFIVIILDPLRYQKEAVTLIQKEQPKPSRQSDQSDFFTKFVALEILLRAFAIRQNAYDRDTQPRMRYSFREIVEALSRQQLIPSEMKAQLLEVNRFRNLYFHGHIQQVDQTLIDTIDKLSTQIRALLRRRKRSAS